MKRLEPYRVETVKAASRRFGHQFYGDGAEGNDPHYIVGHIDSRTMRSEMMDLQRFKRAYMGHVHRVKVPVLGDVSVLAVRVDAPWRVLEAAAALVERMPPRVAAGIEGRRSMKSNDMGALVQRVQVWARDRKLTHPEHGSTPEKQYLKLGEEFGELGAALARNNHNETVDAIGDLVVVLTIMAELINRPIEDCLASVLEVIEKRRGEMRNGVFVKEEDLEEGK